MSRSGVETMPHLLKAASAPSTSAAQQGTTNRQAGRRSGPHALGSAAAERRCTALVRSPVQIDKRRPPSPFCRCPGQNGGHCRGHARCAPTPGRPSPLTESDGLL
eukprot:351806-Chlamydomonas_euryale.AAC.1